MDLEKKCGATANATCEAAVKVNGYICKIDSLPNISNNVIEDIASSEYC